MNELCGMPLSREAREIAEYLVHHPSVRDTLEGIAQWRLPTFRIEREIAVVKSGLEELIAVEFVQSVSGRDGHLYYQINPAKVEEIRVGLRGAPPSPERSSTHS